MILIIVYSKSLNSKYFRQSPVILFKKITFQSNNFIHKRTIFDRNIPAKFTVNKHSSPHVKATYHKVKPDSDKTTSNTSCYSCSQKSFLRIWLCFNIYLCSNFRSNTFFSSPTWILCFVHDLISQHLNRQVTRDKHL